MLQLLFDLNSLVCQNLLLANTPKYFHFERMLRNCSSFCVSISTLSLKNYNEEGLGPNECCWASAQSTIQNRSTSNRRVRKENDTLTKPVQERIALLFVILFILKSQEQPR